MNKITLHSNGCPNCKVLEAKLKDKNIEFEKNSDLTKIIDAGFRSVPVLEVDGMFYGYLKAISWVNKK